MTEFVAKYYGCKLHKAGRDTYANPCPICGHNDDFAVEDGKKAFWRCFSSSGNTGGNIITFLQEYYRISKQEAMEKFKYDLMGHSREEWDRAYKDKRQAERVEAMTYTDVTENEKKKEAPEDIRARLEKRTAATVATGLNDYVKSIRPIETGFNNLDEKLGGGLFAGLYALGAVSSLGKTSFCIQLADQLALKGNKVAIFSIEMTEQELIAKSISRKTYDIAKERYGTEDRARTTRGILTGSLYECYDSQTKQLIEDATEEYKQGAKNIWIYHSEDKTTCYEIKEALEEFKLAYGEAPIVFVDYLQIIGSPEPEHNLTDKQITDRNIVELRKLSLKYNTPIIVISSFNRESYTQKVGTASFKESGGIEYSADVLIGLQYSGMEDAKDGADVMAEAIVKGNEGKEIPIDIKILKSRNGARGSVKVLFTPKFNSFREDYTENDAAQVFSSNPERRRAAELAAAKEEIKGLL